MKKHILKYTSALLLILCMGAVSCDDRDDELKTLDLDRVLIPYELQSELADITELTLTWKAIEGAEGYVVELYTDEDEFKEENFYYTGEVLTNEFRHSLQGDTRFSARVKSVSTTNNDSKWSKGITFKTGFKSMFLPIETGDKSHDSHIFRWIAGMNATELVLTTQDGEEAATHTITASEIALGVAEVTGLTENTRYTVTLYSGETRLGVMDITTSNDIGDAILITNKEELVEKLANANDGDLFYLMGGVYDLDEALVINKNIIITGEEDNKPILNGHFDIENINNLEIKNLILDGGDTDDYPFAFKVLDQPYGDIVMEGLVVQNYTKSFISAGSNFKTTVNSLSIHDCIVGNITATGNSPIDIRNGLISEIKITSSTFYNLGAVDFIRMDGKISGGSPIISILNSTFDSVSTKADVRLFYIRYSSVTYVLKETIFSNTEARLLNATKDRFAGENNNYHQADAAKKQDTGTFSNQDPQYLNPSEGKFNVGNPSITAGDPRWLSAE